MGVREWWSQQDTLVKLLVVLGVAFVLVVTLVVVLVIVAAILGTFVLGLAAETGEVDTPDASFTAVQESDGDVRVAHDEGDSLDDDRVSVRLVGGDGRTVDWTEDDGRIDPGDSVQLDDVDPDATVEVRWETDGGETVTLARFVAEDG
jgi:FlaG/FlaF family flagellin (archaellin)